MSNNEREMYEKHAENDARREAHRKHMHRAAIVAYCAAVAVAALGAVAPVPLPVTCIGFTILAVSSILLDT